MDKKLSKHFFLISFLPAVAYWYMETRYSLRIALTAGLGLAAIEIILELIFTRHVHTLSKFNFGLILFLGAIALIGNEGIWFKLQPLFTGIAIFSFMTYRLIRGDGLLYEMMESMPNANRRPPKFLVQIMERHVSLFFLLYGVFMGSLAIWASTDRWLFFKTIGFYIAFALFMVAELPYIRHKARKGPPEPKQVLIRGRVK